MTNATEQKHRNYLQKILYFYWLLGLFNDIVTTLNGWLTLDNNYIYSAYNVLEIVPTINPCNLHNNPMRKYYYCVWFYLWWTEAIPQRIVEPEPHSTNSCLWKDKTNLHLKIRKQL